MNNASLAVYDGILHSAFAITDITANSAANYIIVELYDTARILSMTLYLF